jgi:hypothetical protein
MSVSKSAGRRRVSLLASSSLVAASLMAGVAGFSALAVAPGVAFAADECGDPVFNAGANDVFTCTGAYAGGVTYTTDGNLRLNLEDGITITGTGLAVTGNAGDLITISATTNVIGAGDPTITNAAGYAINVAGNSGLVNIDLRTSDIGADGSPGPQIGGGRGIRAVNSGDVTIRMNEGNITTAAGFGVLAQSSTGDITVTLTNGTTVNSSGTAIVALAPSGSVNVITSGLITSAADGIFANGADGVSVTSGAVTANGGVGISATSAGGPVVVTTNGAVQGLNGISASANTTGSVVVDLGGAVIGTAGNGVTMSVANGSTLLLANGNAITATGGDGVSITASGSNTAEAYLGDVTGDNGVVVAAAGGAQVVVVSTGLITAVNGVGVDASGAGQIDVMVNDINATDYGVVAASTGGPATVTVTGAVVGDGGVAAQSGGAGAATVTLLAGSSVDAAGTGYGAFAQSTGSGDANVNLGGDVLGGGVGGFAAGTGGVNVLGAGSVTDSNGFDGIETISLDGATVINVSGAINTVGAGDGIDADTDTGALTIGSAGAITAGGAGIEATSTSGAIIVNAGGTIVAVAEGVSAVTDGPATVNASGSILGGTGIDLTTFGTGDGTVNLLAGSTTAADSEFGYGATVSTFGSGNAVIAVGGDVTQGGVGAFALGTGGVSVTGAGAITLTGGFSAVDTFADTGVTTIALTGALTSTGGDGVNAFSNSGLIDIDASGPIVAGGGDGILAESLGGSVLINNDGLVTAAGTGIHAIIDGGAATIITGAGDIAGGGAGGILAETGAGGGTILITYDGDVGSSGSNTTDSGILGYIDGGVGSIVIVATGDVFTDGAGFFGAGVGGASFATSGDVVVAFQGTMESGSVGIAAGIFDAANTGSATAIADHGSVITAGEVGVLATVAGTGNALVTIGDNVTIDPEDFGVSDVSAGGDATVVAGANLTVLITDTDSDGVATGIYAESGRAADAAAGDEAVEIGLGVNASITIDDGAGGDADGALGIGGVAIGAAGSVLVQTGDDLSVTITGTNSVGIGATSVGGDIAIVTGTGVIDIFASDALDAPGNFPGSAGIGAVSATGSIVVRSTVDIAVNNGALVAAGIRAQTAGAGDVTVISAGQILSSGYGVSAEAADGDVFIQSTAAVAANLNTALSAVSTGAGDITVLSTANLTSAQFHGISATNIGADGAIFISSSGAQITAGIDGIAALNLNAANAQAIEVFNTSSITANTTGIGGYGIYATNAGDGGIVVTNSGPIAGTALSGIVATDSGAAGGIAILNTGAIGSALDEVTDTGILGEATGGASINIQSTGGGIWAGVTGIRADSTSTGAVQVFTTVASPITVSGGGGAGIWATANGGMLEVASNAVINSGGDGIIAANVGGSVTVGVSGAVTATGGDGIDASTSNAALLVNVVGGAAISGTANGILAVNGGTGTVTVSAGGDITGTGAAAAGIVATTAGTDLVTVNAANGVTITDPNGSGIRTTSGGGAVVVNVGTGGAGALATLVTGGGAGATSWVLDLNNAAGGLTTINVASNGAVRSTDATVGGYDDAAIRGVGGSVIVNNGGRINGRVDFSGLTGNAVFNNTSLTSWHTTGTSTFSAGADILNNTGSIFTNAGAAATTLDFGAGADTFANSGLLVVGEPAQGAATLTITGLETWTNSGRIVFGSSGTSMTAASDGQINDRILASGATFTGSGASRLVMDANLGATTQVSCAVLTAADCLSLTGGSTAGGTLILVNDVSPSVFGAFNPTGIVLVDVTGAGTTAAANFSLDPGSDFWRADASSPDGVLDKGLFFYDLTLNGAKQHVLVGLPDSEAFEFTTFGQAAQSIWYTTTGTWMERQADLRGQLDQIDGQGAAGWMKITGSSADRDLTNSYDLFGTTYSFDTSYNQTTMALIGGIDFIGGGAGHHWVFGGQIGYVDSDVDFDASPTVTSFEGMTAGLYGTYVAGPVFVDAILNANFLDVDHDAVTLSPPPNSVFSGEVNSVGVQVEGGWTVPIGANGFFEPLGSLSYLNTDIDGLSVPGADISWDDQTSFRVSLGGRLGVTADHGTFSTRWSLVARYWNEFEGENGIMIDTAGPDLDLGDDFSGGFGEVGGTVNVYGADDRFSAFLNVGTKFKDDYSSTDASLGLRWRW